MPKYFEDLCFRNLKDFIFDHPRVALGTAAAIGILSTYAACSKPKADPGVDYADLIRNAETITIDENRFHIGKHYDVYVDGDLVGTVEGRAARLLGDTFTLTTLDDRVLASEDENIRFLRYNRAATFHDQNGDVSGYLGEERVRDLLSISYIFHFYDEEQEEIGRSEKFTNSSLWGVHRIYDNDDDVLYTIDKRFQILGWIDGDRYTLDVVDSTREIPVEHAILLACIEDAIGDAN